MGLSWGFIMYIFMVFVPPFFSEGGLTLQKALIGIPIFASGQKANIKAEQQKIAFYENEQQVKKAQLETEYRSALNAYQTQKAIVENFQNKQLPQAEQIFKTAKEQFVNGEINYLDWVLLNNQATQIQTNYYQAVTQLNQTAITLLYLISK